MNPLKTLFSKVFDSAPPKDAVDDSKQDAAFEWNPDQETVGPTSARTTSWKRGDAQDESPGPVHGEATHEEIAASAHSLPTPMFEKHAPSATPAASSDPPARPTWKELTPVGPAAPLSTEDAAFIPGKAAAAAGPRGEASISPAPGSQDWVKPSAPDQPAAMAPAFAQPVIPLSDFEDVYRKAGIKSPVHGYGVERVYRLLTSRRLVGLDRSIKRSALLTALDAAGVPASDVSQDAVLRRKALTAYEAEKALELQSLRSRNESRAEALQDNVETFTRQKQSQIERLAQGSTSAVRAQSDLEIRKRMEQDRLYRSLAYFVEPLPPGTGEARPAFPEPPTAVEKFDATIEIRPLAKEEVLAAAPDAEISVPESPKPPTEPGQQPAAEAATGSPAPASTGVADTLPLSQSGLEMALKAAAEEARKAGWGKAAIIEDGAGDTVDALRRLREPPKTESES